MKNSKIVDLELVEKISFALKKPNLTQFHFMEKQKWVMQIMQKKNYVLK